MGAEVEGPKEATIYVVDDDPSICKSLERLFRADGYQVRSFQSADKFLETCPEDEIGCIILDVQMPGLCGPEVQTELERRGIQVPVIFLTGHGDIRISVQAMKAGAADFFTKPFDSGELLARVQEAVAKDEKFRQSRAERLEIETRLGSLTRREREVFQCVISGFPNKKTATRLGAAEKTIKVHRGRVMSKMHAKSVAELVVMAVKVGVSPSD